MHRIRVFRLLMLYAILFFVATNLTAQEPLTESQRDSLIAERWDFRTLDFKYPNDFRKIRGIIQRYCPYEIDTMVAMGNRELESRKWRRAKLWYEVALIGNPENLMAHYGCGICRREIGKNKAFFLRGPDWKASQRHFEKIIASDSMYQDVFYQYALLEKYREHLFKAILLAHRQIAANPTAYTGLRGIFRLYDYMIHNKSLKKAEPWLNSRNSAFDEYYLGELYRIHGLFGKADSIFHAILVHNTNFPLQPVYLSLVKIYVQKNEPEKAEAAYWQAVNKIFTRLEADLLLEDFMYIVHDDEYNILKDDKYLMMLPNVMKAYWLKRDPTPAAPYNQRLIAHYQRLLFAEKEYYYDGFRHEWYKDASSREFRFPAWYFENDKFNDMGLIYIRFGEPDERAFAIARDLELEMIDSRNQLPSNMSWLYLETTTSLRMIFHFYIPRDAPPGYWSMVTAFNQKDITAGMAGWDNSPLEVYVLNRVREVEHAMKNDRHTWPKETENLELHHIILRFRNTDTQDLFQLSYAVPLSNLSYMNVKTDSVSFESGIVIFDERMTPLFKDRRDFRLVDPSDTHIWNNLFIDEFEVPLPVGRYNVAVHARTLDGSKVNGWRYRYTLPDSARDRLACSSLKLAFDISPKTAESDNRHRNDLKIIPNPTKIFNRNQPVYVYYEVYNLTYNEQGMTDYAVNFILSQTGKKKGIVKKISGIFGSGEKYQVSVESEQVGDSRTATDYISFDMSRAKAGEYELILEVRDKVSGEEATAFSEIILE